MDINLKLTISFLLPSAFMSLAVLYGAACGGTQQPSSIPTSTPSMTEIQPSPIHTPTPSSMKQPVAPTPPTTFTTPISYDAFPNNLRSAFKAAVDSEFTAIKEKSGISVAVYTDGTLWTYATGEANVTVPMTANTPMFISSMSKTFLSALILIQLESGLYKITDSLGAVLSNHPDFPSFDPAKINPEVTIQELLTMSSGLPEYSENKNGIGEIFKQPSWQPSDKINLVQSQFIEPGSFKYNDTNSALLGLIAQHYSGQTLADLYRQTFYNPLGMQAITLPEEGIAWHRNILYDKAEQFTVPDIAFPYGDLTRWSSGFGNIIQAAPFEFGYYIVGQGRIRWACCEIVSTAESIARWTYELYRSNGSAISESARSRLIDSFSADRVPPWNRPKTIPEEYGYFVAKKVFQLSNERIVTAYGHRGGGGGYSSWMYYSPELDLSISILTNSDEKHGPTGGGFNCTFENPGSCITLLIFDSFSSNLPSTSQQPYKP
jgi:CubicO group peptidase (beta-lactamase class C family)